MERKDRKHPRLKAYDYRENGCYFVTICVRDHKPLLGCVVVRRAGCPHPAGQAAVEMRLSHEGEVTQYYIEQIPRVYREVLLDQYVVMPNHVHLLLRMQGPDRQSEQGEAVPRPTLHTVVRSLKTMVTKKLGYSIWQTSYYEHIVRNRRDYQEIWKYIEGNPAKWAEDRYFQPYPQGKTHADCP